MYFRFNTPPGLYCSSVALCLPLKSFGRPRASCDTFGQAGPRPRGPGPPPSTQQHSFKIPDSVKPVPDGPTPVALPSCRHLPRGRPSSPPTARGLTDAPPSRPISLLSGHNVDTRTAHAQWTQPHLPGPACTPPKSSSAPPPTPFPRPHLDCVLTLPAPCCPPGGGIFTQWQDNNPEAQHASVIPGHHPPSGPCGPPAISPLVLLSLHQGPERTQPSGFYLHPRSPTLHLISLAVLTLNS